MKMRQLLLDVVPYPQRQRAKTAICSSTAGPVASFLGSGTGPREVLHADTSNSTTSVFFIPAA